MQIKFQAFNLTCTSSILPCNDFFEILSKMSTAPYITRNIYTIKLPHHEDIYAGLVLTIKDMKKFCTLVEKGKVIQVIEHKLNDNESMTEFNFFIFDVKNKYGMYQYYYHSCSLKSFIRTILYRIYNENVRDRLNSKKTKLEDAGNSEQVIRRKLEEYRGTLHYSIIERRGAFEERIRRMRKLDSVEFEILAPIDKVFSGFARLTDAFKKQKYTFSFKPEVRTKGWLTDTIAAYFAKNKPTRAVVKGEDAQGEDTVYKLVNDFDSFAEYNYDDLVQSLMLDSSDIEKSISGNDIVKKLIIEYDKKKEYFLKQ